MTHIFTTRLTGCLAALAGAAALAACGTSSDGTSPTATIGESGVKAEIGNTINYASTGTTADIDCAEGKSLTVGGNNNTLTVKGTCASVNIGGTDNKVTFEHIEKDLTVVGLNNNVTYQAGDPKVSDVGKNNTIGKG